ncbi:MAG: hypothetical protein JNG90_15465 [Planctomycetaceae bacterium]|nr:hypothetical protein [Planctomycetaceae bacterium]
MSSGVNDKTASQVPLSTDPAAPDEAAAGVRFRHLIMGLAVKGGGAGIRFLTWTIRAFWYVALAIYCLPVLINLRALWRYQATGKLVVRSYDPFMYAWIVITAAPLLSLAEWFGSSPLYLGYIYLVIVSYAFYTAGRDVTWRRGWVVFAFALAVLAAIWALGERMEYAFFRKAGEALAETGVVFPRTWALGLSAILFVLYVQMLIERFVSGTLTLEGDKLLVKELGESAADHERSAYSIVARTDDVNEFILGFSKSLILRPRSSKDPEYQFRHVPGLSYLMPTILALTTNRGSRSDELDDHGAGDGHAEGDGDHHG